ncbi:cationic amino acid transporter [Saccharomycopsis crataegensis]|uniref:Cationic amino acid transporter n=1 Tax=Saccharomycopsis crataegensis TaxID=43959 RepID=A0AAV5QWI1_9ASCO|nr:cationic amino acid transporter [Saccharomycopsis crataegensis]
MFDEFAAPPSPVVLNAQAVSGILGSISIACWIIVFAPQIYENFCRKSADGLSLLFVVLWLIGDIFNVIGSIAQNVLPTMLILAIYYTLADIVLLIQCLLYGAHKKVDPIHLSPANPLSEDVLDEMINSSDSTIDETRHLLATDSERQAPAKKKKTTATSKWKSDLYNFILIALVLVSGVLGWYISYIRSSHHDTNTPPDHNHDNRDDVELDPIGQFFGYLCAVFYLCSRVPQIVLNFKRKSCDGISFLFFFFACIGNFSYVASILCIGVSWHYVVVNMSWLIGSIGTLFLDAIIFVQFFIYNEEKNTDDYESINDDVEEYP